MQMEGPSAGLLPAHGPAIHAAAFSLISDQRVLKRDPTGLYKSLKRREGRGRNAWCPFI